jgi:hypothetical protein
MVRESTRSTSSAQVLVQSCGHTEGTTSSGRRAAGDAAGRLILRGYHPAVGGPAGASA